MQEKAGLTELVVDMARGTLREDNEGRIGTQINLPLNLVPYGCGEWTERTNNLDPRSQKRAYLSVLRRGHGQMIGFLLHTKGKHSFRYDCCRDLDNTYKVTIPTPGSAYCSLVRAQCDLSTVTTQ